MSAPLQMELKQDAHEHQGGSDSKLDHVQRIVQAAIEPVAQQQRDTQGVQALHNTALRDMRPQIADIRFAQNGTAESVTNAKRHLAMMDSTVLPPPPLAAGWDGTTVAKGTCEAGVAMAAP